MRDLPAMIRSLLDSLSVPKAKVLESALLDRMGSIDDETGIDSPDSLSIEGSCRLIRSLNREIRISHRKLDRMYSPSRDSQKGS